MEQAFESKSLSIKALFRNDKSLYKIPEYQRPYRWQDEQIEQLWSDVHDAYEDNKESSYFIGSVITAEDEEKSGYVNVVDGQQRLTTLMILFCVIRDLFPKLNENKVQNDVSAISIKTIRAVIADDDIHHRLKIFTHDQHQSDFQNLIIKEGNALQKVKPKKRDILNDEEPKYKFINTAHIFHKKLSELGQDKAESLINFLFNQVYIVRIDCKDTDFAVKLFQVINDRGMDLTAADLIKSFLLGSLSKKYDDTSYCKMMKSQFMKDWTSIEQTINKTDISLNDLFIIYQYYILDYIPKKSVFSELQTNFKVKDPNEVINDIKEFANKYANDIAENTKDDVLYAFRYLPWNMYWKSILVTALHTHYTEYEQLKTALRRFYYLYWIAGYTLSKIKGVSFNIIKLIKEKKPIADIIAEVNKKISDDKVIDMALQNLESDKIAQELWIKPLLLLMEYNATDDSKLAFIKLNPKLHLEHILPQEKSKWLHIDDDTHNKWVNSAGNLTLLSGTKNIVASNDPFDAKMLAYRGNDNKITAFQITQCIVNDYEIKKFNQQWTVDAMIDRWKWFFTEVEKLLAIDAKEQINKHQPESE